MITYRLNFLSYLAGFILIVIFYSLYMSAKEKEIQMYTAQRQEQTSQVLYFGAGWCEPCKTMKQMFEQKDVKSELDKLSFTKYDIDVNTKERDKWAIKLVPTLIFIDKTGKIRRSVGILKNDEFLKILSELSN